MKKYAQQLKKNCCHFSVSESIFTTGYFSDVLSNDRFHTVKLKIGAQYRRINSLHDPIADAKRYLAKQNISQNTPVVLAGMGMGYLLKEIAAVTQQKIIVLEHDVALLGTAFSLIDFTDLDASQLIFLIGNDINRLSEVLQSQWQELIHEPIYQVEHPTLHSITAEYQKVGTVISHFYEWVELSIKHEVFFAKTLTQNLILNIPSMSQSSPHQALNALSSDYPAIIVSAGPSLTQSIDTIKKFQSHCLVICVDTALQIMAKHEITPDLIVTSDYRAQNEKHFQGLPQAFFEIPLIYEPTVHFSIPRLFKGAHFLIHSQETLFQWCIPRLKLDPLIFSIQPTMVSHAALLLAQYLNCPATLLFGQDFAYLDQHTHAAGAKNQKTFQIKNDLIVFSSGETTPVYWVNTIKGQPLPTNQALFTALHLTEKILSKTTAYNFSKGALIQGTLPPEQFHVSDFSPINRKKISVSISHPALKLTKTMQNLKKMDTLCRQALKTAPKSIDKLLRYYNQILAFKEEWLLIKRNLFKQFLVFNSQQTVGLKLIFEGVIESIHWINECFDQIKKDIK